MADTAQRNPASPAELGCLNLVRVFVVLWLAAIFAAPAQAEIWGYVDEHGATHVARTKIDDRYQLFYKGDSNVDLAEKAPPHDTGTLEQFRQSEFYQHVVNSRNFKRFESLIVKHAQSQKLDPALVRAVISVESAFDPEALSPKGALGLMQVIPETAMRYGVIDDRKGTVVQKLLDPATNLRIGTRYLRDLLAMFSDNLALALAAYNAGEQTVLRYNNRIPPYPETREYVTVVQRFYDAYRPPSPEPPKRSRITVPRLRTPIP